MIAVIDIDAVKRYDTQVEDSEEYVKALVDTVTQPMCVLDDRERIRAANGSFCKLIGAAGNNDVIGRSLDEAGGLWTSGGWASLIEAVRSAGGATDYRIVESAKGGRGITVHARRIRLNDMEGGTLIALGESAGGSE